VPRHSAEVQRAAVERAFNADGNAAAVAHELGVHPTTLYRWAKLHGVARFAPDQESAQVRLIKTTQRLLSKKDYNEITVEAVADAAGVARRTAFHHFASKRDLFHAAIDDAAIVLIAAMADHYEGRDWPSDPREQLQTFLKVSAAAIYATPSAHVLFRDLGVPRAERFGDRWHTRFKLALEEQLTGAAAAGALMAGIDASSAAQGIARALRGIHAAVFEGLDERVGEWLAERLALVVLADRAG